MGSVTSNDPKKSSCAIFSLLVSLENQRSTIYSTSDSFVKSVDHLFVESIKVNRLKRLLGKNATSAVRWTNGTNGLVPNYDKK